MQRCAVHCEGRDELNRYGLNDVVHCLMCVSTLVGVIRVVNYASFVNRTMWMFTDIAGGRSRGLGFEGELVMHCSSMVVQNCRTVVQCDSFLTDTALNCTKLH